MTPLRSALGPAIGRAATSSGAPPSRRTSRWIPSPGLEAYWTLPKAILFDRLCSRDSGLSAEEATARLRAGGPNRIRSRQELSRVRTLAAQIRSPLLLLLLFAAGVSIVTGEWADAATVLVIVAATVGVGYAREYSAQAAAAALEQRLQTLTTAVRLGQPTRVPVEDIVPGDVVQLYAGSLVPGDGMLLEATDFFVSQAVLTGESFPVEKRPGQLPATAALAERTNCLFLGTSVQSGTARYLVVRTGLATEFGAIAGRLKLGRPDTEFDRGIRRFGYLLMIAMLIMVLLVFAVNVLNGRPAVETLLFSVALAVGLSPELLPAILTINLARGARAMAGKGVLVRHLNAIENLGSMDILCTDKTGTLTEGVVNLGGAYDPAGLPSAAVRHLGAMNALLETGLRNPLDEAILAAEKPDRLTVEKLAEVPFDFLRKRVSVIVRLEGVVQLITKGAFLPVLDVCTSVAGAPLDPAARQSLIDLHNHWAAEGIRVLGVAVRALPSDAVAIGRDAEYEMEFVGFLTFLDRPKASAAAAIRDMAKLGVAIKLITGDARLVAGHVAALVGIRHEGMLTGQDLREMNDAALWHAAECTDVFAEVDPMQKERIIRALGRTGHVVGFLGDGVNDAPAMHAADTSLSVQGAADVARESADFVLLERDLDVIRQGIEAGRRTFANTEKYILTTTSANLGNMASMAIASLVLPFLPLTAGQILLNNFLSDIPAIGIAGDGVDPELVAGPRRWNLRFIGRFMVEFGVLSSVFDVLTFATLLTMFKSPVAMFRTGWFVESLLTELAIAMVVRTRRPFFRSRPGSLLAILTGVLMGVAFVLPYLPGAGVLGFMPLPPGLVATLVAITASYVGATEWLKRSFFRQRGAALQLLDHPVGRFGTHVERI
jgi:Mg2+-importing ATPase